jgi:hypothetical protein
MRNKIIFTVALLLISLIISVPGSFAQRKGISNNKTNLMYAKLKNAGFEIVSQEKDVVVCKKYCSKRKESYFVSIYNAFSEKSGDVTLFSVYFNSEIMVKLISQMNSESKEFMLYQANKEVPEGFEFAITKDDILFGNITEYSSLKDIPDKDVVKICNILVEMACEVDVAIEAMIRDLLRKDKPLGFASGKQNIPDSFKKFDELIQKYKINTPEIKLPSK